VHSTLLMNRLRMSLRIPAPYNPRVRPNVTAPDAPNAPALRTPHRIHLLTNHLIA